MSDPTQPQPEPQPEPQPDDGDGDTGDTDEAREKRGGPSSHDTAGQFPADDLPE